MAGRQQLPGEAGQQPGRVAQALELGGRQQLGQALVQLGGLAHAARGEQARQQRRDAGLLQRPGGARRDFAFDQLR